MDACVSNYVLEHVEDPHSHLVEVTRVLKPGGLYLFRTPNKFHYVSLVARITPHWFHHLVANRLRNKPAGDHEPYPTFHRLNSRRDIFRHAKSAWLQVDELRFVEKEPSYGFKARPLFFGMMLFERLVNSTNYFSGMRANIFGVLRRAVPTGPSSC